MGKIFLPEQLTIDKVLAFGLEVDRFRQAQTLELVMGENRWFPPFALLFLSTKLRGLLKGNPTLKIEIKLSPTMRYLDHMGFLTHIFGSEPVKDVFPSQNSRCIPITRVTLEDLLNSTPDAKFKELGDLIQTHADSIAEMISRDFERKDEVFQILAYSLREVMRNTFEHSNANELFYCGQFWPTTGKVEVSIADLGTGIRRALGENPNFRFNRDKEAIEQALMPGVSGKTHQPRKSEVWFNSGYGLYMTNRLARNGGNFVIASGSSGIYLSANSKNKKTNYQTSFPGTVLRLNFDVNEIGSLAERLSEFRKQGEIIQMEMAGNAGRPPSGMSLVLRRDFH